MRKSISILLTLLIISGIQLVKGQTTESTSGTHIYLASAGETIFSWGQVEAGQDQLTNVVRFTPFFNVAQQVHFDFSNNIGFYTGLDVRNVGVISHTVEGYKIKERAYALGIPAVFKVGNLTKGFSLGVGAEAEFMFAYKQKIIVNDYKTKSSSWFSDNVNIFNPSLLVEIKSYRGPYVRFKYYLDDFLNYQQGGLTIPLQSQQGLKVLPDYGISSQMMYVSIGTVIAREKLNKGNGTSGAFNEKDGFFRTVKSNGSVSSATTAQR